jgi:hypothetical protein
VREGFQYRAPRLDGQFLGIVGVMEARTEAFRRNQLNAYNGDRVSLEQEQDRPGCHAGNTWPTEGIKCDDTHAAFRLTTWR